MIRNKISPAIYFNVSHFETDEHRIIIRIDVPVHKGSVVVYKDHTLGYLRERVYRRYSGSTYELTSISDITNYTISKRTISYDLTPTEYQADDYTFHSLNEKYKEQLSTDKNLTVKNLKSLGLITENNYLTIAGMYFADQCSETFPSIHLRKWPGFNKGSDHVIDAKEYKVNLIEQLNEAEKFIRNNTKTGIRKAGGGASNAWSYPAIAVTEALCNAIGHRDYLISGTQIDVDIYQDRIEIVSPGSFLPEGKAQDYLQIDKIPSRRRNDAITETLAKCNLMQKFGSGFEKILEEYAPYSEEYQPKISSEREWFTITLKDVMYKKDEIAKNLELSLPKIQGIVYEIIANNPGFRSPEIASLSELNKSKVENAVKALRSKQLIEYAGTKRKGGYFIVSDKITDKTTE